MCARDFTQLDTRILTSGTALLSCLVPPPHVSRLAEMLFPFPTPFLMPAAALFRFVSRHVVVLSRGNILHCQPEFCLFASRKWVRGLFVIYYQDSGSRGSI